MFHATALVTMVNLSTNKDGTIRKRGLTVQEIQVKSGSQRISLRSLRIMLEWDIRRLFAGQLQGIRQVDIYIKGECVRSYAPQFTKPIRLLPLESVIEASEQSTSDDEYRESLRRMDSEWREFFNRNKPVAAIFGRDDIGDDCCEAIESLDDRLTKALQRVGL